MIYFDNSATTRPSEACIKAVDIAMKESYANASSLHIAGVHAKRNINDAKKAIAKTLNCTPAEILICPGGTYANNLAMHSAIITQKRNGKKIVISSIEHPSVSEYAERLKEFGYEVVLCNPLDNSFEKEIDNNTVLVSCMLVNNETGLLLPVKKLKQIINKSNSPALLHIDAVQAFGKIKVNVKDLGCDFLTVSAHKINGPKGIGALYVKKGNKVHPILHGGEQENSLVPGTYNTYAAAGFAAAVKELNTVDAHHYEKLYTHFMLRVKEFDFISVNEFGDHAKHIINITFNGYLGENILHYLEGHEIYVSQGSACSSHSKQKSKTLLALGKSKQVSDGSLRISFDRYNTISEVDTFFEVCSTVPQKMIKLYK